MRVSLVAFSRRLQLSRTIDSRRWLRLSEVKYVMGGPRAHLRYSQAKSIPGVISRDQGTVQMREEVMQEMINPSRGVS
jgi:hypothetical protein